MRVKQIRKILWYTLLLFFGLFNLATYYYAYQFTHFRSEQRRMDDPWMIRTLDHVLPAMNQRKPQNQAVPMVPFEQVRLKVDDLTIGCWYIPTAATEPKGTVALFHGYLSKKSTMLDKAYLFRDWGYNTLLVDFRGSGDSQGNQTTIGYKEGGEVLAAYWYLRKEQKEDKIVLLGNSMGAAAVLKALDAAPIKPAGVILECPFGTMYDAVAARCKTVGFPSFPTTDFLLFWGSVQGGFWAYNHDPQDYAKNVQVPTLLIYGAKDDRVSMEETQAIFANLPAKKQLKVYPNAGHGKYLGIYRNEWMADVRQFLDTSLVVSLPQ